METVKFEKWASFGFKACSTRACC